MGPGHAGFSRGWAEVIPDWRALQRLGLDWLRVAFAPRPLPPYVHPISPKLTPMSPKAGVPSTRGFRIVKAEGIGRGSQPAVWICLANCQLLVASCVIFKDLFAFTP
jgi:hypothetical protein